MVGSLSAAAALSGVARKAAAVTAGPNQLSFYHIHTGEKLKIAYRENGLKMDRFLVTSDLAFHP